MRIAAIAWCTDIPGLQVYLFRRVSDDLAKNHMEGHTGFPALLAEWIEAGHVKINWSKNFIEFWNGSKIHLCHCQYEKDVTKYQGAQIGVLMIDELTHFTAKIYRYLRARLRLGGLKIPKKYQGMFPRALCGSNPGGIGHNWVKSAFIDGAAPMQIIEQPKTEGGMRRQYIQAKLADNPTMAESDPDYADRLDGLGNPALVKAMKDGDWNIVAGGMFDDLWSEPAHVLAPFRIPTGWRIDRSFDWGSTRPFSVGWWAEADGTEAKMPDGASRSWPRGTVFRIAEWYGWNGKPNEGLRMLATDIASEIVKKEAEMGFAGRVKPGPADSSIFDTQNGVCIADDMARRGVKWERADKGPGSRRNGWEKMRGMLSAARSVPMEAPGLLVFDTCRHFIRTVPVLPRSERDPDDVDSDAEDHVADEARYRLTQRRSSASSETLRL
ncbi:MAG: terminase family protein [Candidatus Kapaibacterium sp.]|jgi:hypothetical protein